MRPALFLAAIIVIVLLACSVYVMAAGGPVPSAQHAAVDYASFITILLTAIAVILAVLAVGVAILAIWGYRQFMNQAQTSARDAATATAAGVAAATVSEHIASDGFLKQLHARIDEVTQRRLAETIQPSARAQEEAESAGPEQIAPRPPPAN